MNSHVKMLSLIRTPVNIPWPSVQTHCMYCTPANRKSKILRLRSTQKQLYGKIIRSDRDPNDKATEKHAPKASNSMLNELKVSAANRTSEFYWLNKSGESANGVIKINRYASLNNKLAAEKPSSERNSANSTNPKESITLTPKSTTNSIAAAATSQPSTTLNGRNAIISAKKIVQSWMTGRSASNPANATSQQDIPFDMDELSSILKYPLVSGKCSLSQTVSLTDRTVHIPSISKVLSATMPAGARIALKKWKMAKIAELGVDGFKQYERETLNIGKEFHAAIEQFLTDGQIPDADSSVNQLWQSVHPRLHELKPKAILLEQPILHADLKYKGIIDNVSLVRDELCAFEWKTSEKAKPKLTSTYDAPVQLCAYLGALNVDPRYDMVVKNGRVAVAYKNGDLANVFQLTETDLRKYWLMWLQRLQEYWIRVKDGTLPDPI